MSSFFFSFFIFLKLDHVCRQLFLLFWAVWHVSRADLFWLYNKNVRPLWVWQMTNLIWTSGFYKNVKKWNNDNIASAWLKELKGRSCDILYNEEHWNSQMYNFILIVSEHFSALNYIEALQDSVFRTKLLACLPEVLQNPLWVLFSISLPHWGPEKQLIQGSLQKICAHRLPRTRPVVPCLALSEKWK